MELGPGGLELAFQGASVRRAASSRKMPDFIGIFAIRGSGTAVALVSGVTDRWAVGNDFRKERDTPWRKR
jgi:hypothetical protein